MKKIICASAYFILIMLGISACQPAGPQILTGMVYDASMNTITLITSKGDTVNISTMNANPKKVPGVLINDSVKIICENKDVDGMKVLTATELTILVHSPYYFIQGTWVEPNPINPKEIQGFKLNENNTASSINMATLQFTGWNLNDRTLMLTGKSIGNGQTIENTDTFNIVRLDADSLILSRGGHIVWKLEREK